jgi:hypothetical protein
MVSGSARNWIAVNAVNNSTSTKKMKTLHLRKAISRSPLQCGLLFIPLALAIACFALPPTARALLPPPAPDGGYLNGNTAEGTSALFNLTSGSSNTANGFNALFFDTTGSSNTATGRGALYHNTTADDNTANGYRALFNNTTGPYNTATGFEALFKNTTGSGNTANGDDTLYSNTTGNGNTANGLTALVSNTSGSNNTATGYDALYNNTSGTENTATGHRALYSNTTGFDNTVTGTNALFSNTDGTANTANGVIALYRNTTGNFNTAIGYRALEFNVHGSNNIALGSNAGYNLATGNNNIDIGNAGVTGESSHIRIGAEGTQTATFIAGISGETVTGTAVVVNSSGRLGVAPSSQRFKAEIKPMDKASEAVLALKPVTFRYEKEIDPQGIPQFGLVAEDVEKVNPDLVARDAEGKLFTVRYEAVNAMLLNEFLKEHEAFVEEHRAVQELKKQVAALTAGLQKVSAQLEASKPAPQVVNNNQ